MIKECQLNLECKVIQIIKRPVHTVFIGEIADVYMDKDCMTNGVPDITKIDPILFAPEPGSRKYGGAYWKLGEYVAMAFEVGMDVKNRDAADGCRQTRLIFSCNMLNVKKFYIPIVKIYYIKYINKNQQGGNYGSKKSVLKIAAYFTKGICW